MTTTLGDGVLVDITPPESVTIEVAPPEQVPVAFTQVPASTTLILPIAGPSGPGAGQFEYVMPTAQTTALVTHQLGYDPVAVQVFVDDVLCTDYSVVFTIPGQQVRIAFDVAVQATIRLM